MANTKVTGDLIASGTITADNLVSGTLDALLNGYLTTNTYATQSYVTTAVNNLIDAAPASLDTLNELAAALNDDANFATTVTNSLATKLNLSGGTLTGDLIVNTNIGIGTSSPSYKLDVNGSMHSTNVTIADYVYQEGDTTTYMGFGGAAYWKVVTGGTSRLEVYNTGAFISTPLYIAEKIGHTGDSNTYMSFPSNDNINWYTNGSERMRINASGNVGIGTSTIGAYTALKIQKAGGYLSVLSDVGSGGSKNPDLAYGINFGYNRSNGDGESNIVWGKPSGLSGYLQFASWDGTTYSERMRIDASGNVGIGTSSPTAKLDVNSGNTNTVAAFRSTDAGAYVGFADNTSTLDAGYPTTSVGAIGDNLILSSANTERMRITSGGGIESTQNNTAQPILKLKQTGTAGYTALRFSGNNDTDIADFTTFNGDIYLGFWNGGNGSNGELRINKATGNVILPNGNLVFSNGKGIDFSATGGAAGRTSNLLDDYEEGTWTPVLKNAGTTTYNTQSGSYTKIGNLVVAHCHLNIGLLDSSVASSNLSVSGLPFTSSFNTEGYAITSSIHTNGWSSTQKPDNGIMSSGINWVDFYKSLGQTGVTTIFNDYIGGGNILFTISYTTS